MSCPACDGTGERFDGDVHMGPCQLCGGTGLADESIDPDEAYEDDEQVQHD